MLLIVAKEKLVNVRLKPQTHDEFKIACELRGASMSSLLHQFIVRTIREEKELSPKAFNSEQKVYKISTPEFDLAEAILNFPEPETIMREWLHSEGREYPSDYGVIFFRGWASFTPAEKHAALLDAKKVLDRTVNRPARSNKVAGRIEPGGSVQTRADANRMIAAVELKTNQKRKRKG